MKIIDIELVKKHIKVDDDYEDELLELYVESAEQTVLNLCDRSIEEIYDIWGKIPPPLKEAVLLIVSSSFTHREAVSMNNLYIVPYALEVKLKPYMKLTI